jgi:IS30 family transposase
MHKYDQSKGMSDQKKISLETGVNVYFAYFQSQKQRGNNENTNGLLRQYFPKGTDLSGYSQEQLDELAWA